MLHFLVPISYPLLAYPWYHLVCCQLSFASSSSLACTTNSYAIDPSSMVFFFSLLSSYTPLNQKQVILVSHKCDSSPNLPTYWIGSGTNYFGIMVSMWWSLNGGDIWHDPHILQLCIILISTQSPSGTMVMLFAKQSWMTYLVSACRLSDYLTMIRCLRNSLICNCYWWFRQYHVPGPLDNHMTVLLWFQYSSAYLAMLSMSSFSSHHHHDSSHAQRYICTQHTQGTKCPAGERLATPTSRKAETGQVLDSVKTKRQNNGNIPNPNFLQRLSYSDGVTSGEYQTCYTASCCQCLVVTQSVVSVIIMSQFVSNYFHERTTLSV